ncbi:MAG TPA: KTSC domain-containing protein [Stellaceae bacterium]|nr:KTSC domain-containing protein [Stellaceae bacterium]
MARQRITQLQAVDSSAIRAIGYAPAARRLFIAYRGARGLYAYDEVAPREWRELLAAPSKGRYVNFRIKPRHAFMRMDDDATARRSVIPPETRAARGSRP